MSLSDKMHRKTLQSSFEIQVSCMLVTAFCLHELGARGGLVMEVVLGGDGGAAVVVSVVGVVVFSHELGNLLNGIKFCNGKMHRK